MLGTRLSKLCFSINSLTFNISLNNGFKIIVALGTRLILTHFKPSEDFSGVSKKCCKIFKVCLIIWTLYNDTLAIYERNAILDPATEKPCERVDKGSLAPFPWHRYFP